MTPPATPQPIPYQGSKRKLAPQILPHLPTDVVTLYEPFAGSGALTVAAARAHCAERYVLSDALAPLVGIWRGILQEPALLADQYEALWNAQLEDPRASYEAVRTSFNATGEPSELLYLLARCVKNAVRFNRQGAFNQSADHRRLGVKPPTMRSRILAVHRLLEGRAEAHTGDYAAALREATPADLVYMDPPYLGVSGAKDRRYLDGLDVDRFVAELAGANERGIRYIVSFDGRKGETTYGPGLPGHLGLTRLELYAGRSSQATLSGRDEETWEALYLSPGL